MAEKMNLKRSVTSELDETIYSNSDLNEWITLNIGGKHFTTTKITLVANVTIVYALASNLKVYINLLKRSLDKFR